MLSPLRTRRRQRLKSRWSDVYPGAWRQRQRGGVVLHCLVEQRQRRGVLDAQSLPPRAEGQAQQAGRSTRPKPQRGQVLRRDLKPPPALIATSLNGTLLDRSHTDNLARPGWRRAMVRRCGRRQAFTRWVSKPHWPGAGRIGTMLTGARCLWADPTPVSRAYACAARRQGAAGALYASKGRRPADGAPPGSQHWQAPTSIECQPDRSPRRLAPIRPACADGSPRFTKRGPPPIPRHVAAGAYPIIRVGRRRPRSARPREARTEPGSADSFPGR